MDQILTTCDRIVSEVECRARMPEILAKVAELTRELDARMDKEDTRRYRRMG